MGGSVWFDVDGSRGLVRGNELRIEGVLMELLDDIGEVIVSITTDESGHYYNRIWTDQNADGM